VLGWNAEEAEQSLNRLTQKGLLDRTRPSSAVEGRYRYHGLVRRYARERLEEILDDGAPCAYGDRRHERHHLAIRLLSHDMPAPGTHTGSPPLRTRDTGGWRRASLNG
jgi:hypothetical protein